MSEAALCPTCNQPLPREPLSYSTRDSHKPNCEYGPKKHAADFIIKGVAVCAGHKSFVQ